MLKPIPFSTNLLGYFSLSLMIFSLICAGLALGLPYWEIYDTVAGSQQTTIYQGLWKYCTVYTPETDSLVNGCDDPVNNGSSATDIRVIKAMLFVSMILMLAACVFVIAALFPAKLRYTLAVHLIAGGIGIVAGLFSLFAMAIYLGRIKKDTYDVHAALSCVVLSALGSWTASAFVVFMGKVKKDDE